MVRRRNWHNIYMNTGRVDRLMNVFNYHPNMYGYTKIGRIGCTQPRRVAAMSVAARVS